jgi:hypothetical protein
MSILYSKLFWVVLYYTFYILYTLYIFRIILDGYHLILLWMTKE